MTYAGYVPGVPMKAKPAPKPTPKREVKPLPQGEVLPEPNEETDNG